MSIPSLDSYLFVTLSQFSTGARLRRSDIEQAIAEKLSLTQDDLGITLKNHSTTKHRNQIRWSLVFLTFAHLLTRIEKGLYQITPQGEAYLSQHTSLLVKDLNQFPEYREWRKQVAQKNKKEKEIQEQTMVSQEGTDASPEETIENAMRTIDTALAAELLDAIKANSWQFFERLVVDLMLAMGYGGSMEDAGQAFQTTGDGGIDGVIKEDRLGLSSIYLQAKHWENPVGRPKIQEFFGALADKPNTRGVFITTSRFTQEAMEYASNKPIVLIDGEKLVQLMIEHDVGVAIRQVYTVKRLDLDYFNEDD